MKLSVEAKVAAAVAAGFMVMSSGAMAQGHKGQSAGSNHYGPTNNPGANTHMNQQGDNSSLFGRTNAEENKPTVSDESVRERREERREHREQREDRRENREQREDRRENREQRQDRHQAHRQREERRQRENAKEKSPFDGSILEVKPGDVSR
jgi:hypothetical protein